MKIQLAIPRINISSFSSSSFAAEKCRWFASRLPGENRQWLSLKNPGYFRPGWRCFGLHRQPLSLPGPTGADPKTGARARTHAHTHIRVYTRARGWAFPCIQNELRFQNEPSPENRFARGSGRPSRNGQAIVKNAIAGAAVSRIGKTFFSPQLISWRRKYRRSLRTGTAIFQRTPASTAGTHWHRRSGQAKCDRPASAQSPLR